MSRRRSRRVADAPRLRAATLRPAHQAQRELLLAGVAAHLAGGEADQPRIEVVVGARRIAQNGRDGVFGNALASISGFFFALLSTRATSSSAWGCATPCRRSRRPRRLLGLAELVRRSLPLHVLPSQRMPSTQRRQIELRRRVGRPPGRRPRPRSGSLPPLAVATRASSESAAMREPSAARRSNAMKSPSLESVAHAGARPDRL